MNRTKIEWTEHTWNWMHGCTPISEGCRNCYAKRLAEGRLRGRVGYPREDPFRVVIHPERITEPLRWRKPKMVFVCSMGDMFHPDVPFEDITRAFDAMASWRWPNKAAERGGEHEDMVDPGHTFQVLTKRPERIHEWLWWVGEHWPGDSPIYVAMEATGTFGPNIWVGTTVELPGYTDRIVSLLQVPAAVRFVSCEPLLGPVDVSPFLGTQHVCKGDCGQWLGRLDDLDAGEKAHCPVCDSEVLEERPGVDWVIAGGETGPKARPMDPDWARRVRDDCVAAGVPFFFKRVGGRDKSRLLNGRTWEQYPPVRSA